MPAPPVTPEHLFLLLWKSFRAVEAHDRRSIRDLGLGTPTDFAVLEVLHAKGPLPVNEIGRKVMLTSGAITTAVDRAEERGLVRRVACPDDRRVVHVHLTPAGRKRIAEALKVHFRNLGTAFSGLTADEQATLADLLRRMGRHAASLLPADRPEADTR